MTTRFLQPGFTGWPPPRDSQHLEPPAPSGLRPIDWHAARTSARACCCPAKPAVIVVMPASEARPEATELLLCGHHYRVSRLALAATGATVLDLGGVPVRDDVWPETHAA